MAVKNSTIMAKAWLQGTNDFQQRIPDPTVSGIAATTAALKESMNRQYFNQFMDILINRIGWVYVRNSEWKNPLAPFKGQKLQYGSTIQEIIPAWLKAHSYDDSSEELLKLERPNAEVIYHSLNRRDKYNISIVDPELKQAFTDEYGLNQLIAGIMQTPMNSDNWDEYKIMLELLSYYDKEWGFYKYHVDEPTTRDTATALLKAIRSVAGSMKFPSTTYNNVMIPTFASSDELVLFTTPEVQASLDVDALAQLFNIDRAEVPMRIVIVDEFPIAGAQALLTTNEFFVCNDILYENTSFYNPETLSTNYYLHHWGVYSVSPYMPAVLFTTEPGTTNRIIEQNVTSFKITSDEATIKPGKEVQLHPTLVGTVTNAAQDEDVAVRPSSATYELVAKTADGKPIQLNARTRVDMYGILHAQKTGLKAGDVITVTATTAYIDPSHASQESAQDLTASVDVTVA